MKTTIWLIIIINLNFHFFRLLFCLLYIGQVIFIRFPEIMENSIFENRLSTWKNLSSLFIVVSYVKEYAEHE